VAHLVHTEMQLRLLRIERWHAKQKSIPGRHALVFATPAVARTLAIS